MEKKDDGEKIKAPSEQYKDFEPSAMAVAPDGGIAPDGVGMAPAVPAATPEHFWCLRGPCRHYWELHTFMASGNPADTWNSEDGLKDESGNPLRIPRQVNRSCRLQKGTETELTEDCVFYCTDWDPLTPRELRKRDKRQRKYFKLHPEHLPLVDDELLNRIED